MSESNDSPDSEIPKGLCGGRAIAMTDLPPRIEFKCRGRRKGMIGPVPYCRLRESGAGVR